MGYGFSLPDNQADHFGIGISPTIASYIRVVKDGRLGRIHTPKPSQVGTSNWENFEMDVIYSVRVHSGEPVFSSGFLEDLSVATENAREYNEANVSTKPDLDISSMPHSRNGLHILCAVFTIIRKGQTTISKYDQDLPRQPQNGRQADAARYRKSQFDILSHVLKWLVKTLHSLIHADLSLGSQFVVISLDDILSDSPTQLQKDFRSVLNAGLKTRDPKKIKDRGGADFAFTVWLAGLLISHPQTGNGLEKVTSSDSPFHNHCIRWLDFLRLSYPDSDTTEPESQGDSSAVLQAEGAAWFDPVRNSLQKENTIADIDATITSYLDAVRIHVDKHPQSLYNSSEMTIRQLAWCYRVISNEGVWVPCTHDPEGDDEWMLCLECPRYEHTVSEE